MNKVDTQEGSVILGVLVAVFAVLSVAFGGIAIWAYMQYESASNDVESKIKLAVSQAEKDQAEKDEQKFAEREKEPNYEFVGPDDYGRLTFKYPKTWSLYEATDIARGGDYKAYIHPEKVPPVSDSQRFAVRVLIENKDYDRVVQQYDSLVKKGDLRSSSTSSQGNTGTRLDGNFNKNIRGSAVIYKLRDKTATIRTDADSTFKADFDKLIQTITFEQ
ncbi:MAG: hypothetical protein Q4B06_00850 [Candidatus Saccharibacteria bacterium]|nr:hypothetical protein [Candidatus Saccharibacteria bacterium]